MEKRWFTIDQKEVGLLKERAMQSMHDGMNPDWAEALQTFIAACEKMEDTFDRVGLKRRKISSI